MIFKTGVEPVNPVKVGREDVLTTAFSCSSATGSRTPFSRLRIWRPSHVDDSAMCYFKTSIGIEPISSGLQPEVIIQITNSSLKVCHTPTRSRRSPYLLYAQTKRIVGLEPTTYTLATCRSTTELYPHGFSHWLAPVPETREKVVFVFSIR